MAASHWVIEQRSSENWTGEDQGRLDLWLNQSTAHAVAYWRAEHAWTRTDRIAALKRPAAKEAARKNRQKRGFAAWGIAGLSSIIVVSGWLAAAQIFGGQFARYTTPVGGHKVVALSDGSRIELNTDSLLRVSHDDRQAFLDKGEAYFEIKHDTAHPFTVQANGRKIVDVGTKFLLRDGSAQLKVILFEGRARLEAPEGSKAAPSNLAAGDVAIATATSTSVASRSAAALTGELSWRQGILVFHRTTLADAATEFNRYNESKLVIADADAGKLRIDGKFRTNDVTSFVEVAKDVLGLRVAKQGDQLVVSR